MQCRTLDDIRYLESSEVLIPCTEINKNRLQSTFFDSINHLMCMGGRQQKIFQVTVKIMTCVSRICRVDCSSIVYPEPFRTKSIYFTHLFLSNLFFQSTHRSVDMCLLFTLSRCFSTNHPNTRVYALTGIALIFLLWDCFNHRDVYSKCCHPPSAVVSY